MPLEVRVDVVPHGVEAARRTLHTVRVTQVEKLDDDPDGERVYRIEGERVNEVTHARGDGAAVLAAKALAADTDTESSTQAVSEEVRLWQEVHRTLSTYVLAIQQGYPNTEAFEKYKEAYLTAQEASDHQ